MYNRVFLAGRIKEKIELQYTNSEIPFVRFDLVVHNANSYYKSIPDTIPCIIWRQNAVLFFEKVKKSMLILLEGKLKGQNNYLEVSVANFQILETGAVTNEEVSSINLQKTTSKPKDLEEKSTKTKEIEKDSDLGIDWGDLKTEKKDDQ